MRDSKPQKGSPQGSTWDALSRHAAARRFGGAEPSSRAAREWKSDESVTGTVVKRSEHRNCRPLRHFKVSERHNSPRRCRLEPMEIPKMTETLSPSLAVIVEPEYGLAGNRS
jgi:hypothetical protein